MAVIKNKTFEITTLRKDIKTDGRHAVVQFTENWEQDAARRDFTFNAISVDLHGTKFDYFGGQQDLKAQTIRFVGYAPDRIKEDYLRILRYFRIIATRGMKPGDPDELKACIDQAGKLKELSAERIRHELFKILSSDMENNIVKLMYESGVLQVILPHTRSPDRLNRLTRLEVEARKLETIQSDPLRRLAAIIETDVTGLNEIVNSLKLSNNEHKRLITMITSGYNLGPEMTTNEVQTTVFKIGSEAVIDLILLNWAKLEIPFPTAKPASKNKWLNMISVVKQFRGREPRLPIKGQDIIDLGVQPGRQISQLLSKVEEWWLQGGCTAERDECLKKIETLIHTL